MSARFTLGVVVVIGSALFVALRSGAVAEEVATAQPTGTAAAEKVKNEPTDVRNVKSGKFNRGPMPSFTPEREAAAMTFVQAHHAELAPLLTHLKKSRPNDYQKAIRKLFGDSERLAHSREAQ